MALNAPSICAVDARFIYLTGGNQKGAQVAKCQRYDIGKNTWLEMQPMHQARCYHSSCQLAGYIYVFCGYDGDEGKTNSVEKLAIHVNFNQQNLIKWQLIPEQSLANLPRLRSLFSIPLNNDDILITGGKGQSEQRVQIYDTRTDRCQSVAVTGAFKFFNWSQGNFSIAQSGHNKVVALVTGSSDLKPYFIKFVKETSSITILNDF